MREGLFSDRDFYTKLRRLGVPIALQSLMLAAVAAGDAIMLGRVTQNSMAAVSLATQIQFVQNMILSAVTAGGAILGAQYWGKGDTRTINDIFLMMLKLAGIPSLLFCLGCLLVPNALMLVFTHDPELIAIGAGYLRIAGWSYLLTGISQCYLTVMKVTDHADSTAWVSSLAVALNIILNAVFIFGLMGLPAMGANGAALATLLARVTELAIVLVFLLRVDRKLRVRPADFLHTDRQIVRDAVRYASPVVLNEIFWTSASMLVASVFGHMGREVVAANSICSVLFQLSQAAIFGLSSSASTIIGNDESIQGLGMYATGYDPELAKELAEKTGLVGKTLILANNGSAEFITISEMVQDMLGKIGVNVEIHSYDSATYTAVKNDKTMYDILISNGVCGNWFIGDSLVNSIKTNKIHNVWDDWANGHGARYVEVMGETLSNMNDEERAKIVQELAEYYVETSPTMGLVEFGAFVAVPEDLDLDNYKDTVINNYYTRYFSWK